MDKTTQKIRIANWKSIIKQCQARPEGQSAKQWLADNGISEKNYYYWQRKIRQETYALISPKVSRKRKIIRYWIKQRRLSTARFPAFVRKFF